MEGNGPVLWTTRYYDYIQSIGGPALVKLSFVASAGFYVRDFLMLLLTKNKNDNNSSSASIHPCIHHHLFLYSPVVNGIYLFLHILISICLSIACNAVLLTAMSYHVCHPTTIKLELYRRPSLVISPQGRTEPRESEHGSLVVLYQFTAQLYVCPFVAYLRLVLLDMLHPPVTFSPTLSYFSLSSLP